MGGCLSDMKGAKEAVGGIAPGNNTNDAVDFFYTAQGFQPLFTNVELSLSASNLLDLDIVSKSDPMAVVYAKKGDGKLEELGRTEVITNSLNPEWIEKINIAFHFEIVQPLVFHVYDIDTSYHGVPTKTLKLNDQEFLGEASCTLSEIVTKQSRSLTIRLQNKGGNISQINQGAITIHAEETVAAKNAVDIIFRCSHLDNKDIFSKSDPFLRISRVVESGGTVPIFKTEVIDNNLNPKWRPLCLNFQQFGSKDTPLLIECFDFNSSGNHVLKGQLFVDQYCEKEQFSFIDYISSGFELNFLVAVDFTASNGSPQQPDSLHYIDLSGRLNSYQKAIMEVGEVIQFYDSDKLFPAWGFGGKIPGGTISHCFNLNGSPTSSEVVGVEGIMEAYGSALRSVTLSGPTLFGPVINMAAQMAAEALSSYNSTKYYVLLIITDGVVTDLQETIDSVVKASDLPLSILIVGVGSADFTSMEVLDADNGRRLKSSTGRLATRDIVQFVPMREVQSGQISVVQALLEELPSQFLAFMRSRDIKPLVSHFPHARSIQ
ncbi:putative C2 domain, von Willebrand factor, type A, copine, protein BONZAI [Medicago truncatula]|uniref:Putative C2 domain, von Willebrand factor, type A, copine, protein BONZAI n=1 Tax=Medicago truncatula TaxID=3880 RepID=A0A396JQ39_MEDTR|nr:putative C2 domain, von Willebrand factor, type A, copine, protein BONZAI [Medicago truncatula]